MRKRNDAVKSPVSNDSPVVGPIGLVGAAIAGVGAALSPTADAATFTVTNLNDSGAGSLRQAIEDGNGAAGLDNVVFQSGVSGTILLTSGQLEISDSLTITGPGAANLSVSGNNASRVFYIYNDAEVIDVTLSGLTIRDGRTFSGNPDLRGGSSQNGAGIINWYESLTLDGVTVTGNYAYGNGGGLWVSSKYEGETLTIRNSTFSNNEAGYSGGGIYIGDTGQNNTATAVLISDSFVTGNTAGTNGGGLFFYDPDDAVVIERTVISGNSAEGGLLRGGIGDNGAGGGVALYDTDQGTFTITGSTISGNSGRHGGGVNLYDPDHEVFIVNTTISGNTSSLHGAGIDSDDLDYDLTIENSTIVDNAAEDDDGGIYMYDGQTILRNSIVANNTPGDIGLYGGTINAAFSLIETDSGAITNDLGGNIFDTDPQLGPLANNGGPTQTHLPLVGSPVIDAGDPNFVPPPSVDQVGNPRVAGGAIDMGAVEAIAQLVPEVPVPALGVLGLAAAALGIGGIGAAALRKRKRGAGPLAALLLGVAAIAGVAPSVEAAKPVATRQATSIQLIAELGPMTHLTLANNQRLEVESAKLVIIDALHRRDSAPVRTASAIPAGQPVVIKTKFNKDGTVKEVRVRLFKTLAAAQRKAAGN